ncbi:ribosomal protein S18-alanine N-acetyltransferase [Psychrobacter sp. UBA3962]|uniref:ribosomal protein S18-alanine N-acetyltransferase n=1 Tax=Psychrobacter sp. UBA3962 TaxID=1947352 RepID=UPI0025F44463|nr:ribosomal protein S18-alanine N-acetyltransferase [Psychrobacter sp. UBA3962]
MRYSEIPNLCQITTADSDLHLLRQVAEIEQMLQLDNWSEQQISELLQQDINQCWGLLETDLSQRSEEKIVAYCLISTVFEVAEVLRIGTHPDYQRRGLAAALLQALIKVMPQRQLERILLEVRQDNVAAIALYKKMGFEVIHVRKGYYSIASKEGEEETNCDALIMQYELTA